MYFTNPQKNTEINIIDLGNSIYFDILCDSIGFMTSNDNFIQKFIVLAVSFVDCFYISYVFKN